MKYKAIFLTLSVVLAEADKPNKENVGKTYADIAFMEDGVLLPDETNSARTSKFLTKQQIALYHDLVRKVNPEHKDTDPVQNVDISALDIKEDKKFYIEELPPFILYQRDRTTGKITQNPILDKSTGEPKVFTQLRILIDLDRDLQPKVAPNNEARRMVSQMGKFLSTNNQKTVTSTGAALDPNAFGGEGAGGVDPSAHPLGQ